MNSRLEPLRLIVQQLSSHLQGVTSSIDYFRTENQQEGPWVKIESEERFLCPVHRAPSHLQALMFPFHKILLSVLFVLPHDTSHKVIGTQKVISRLSKPFLNWMKERKVCRSSLETIDILWEWQIK